MIPERIWEILEEQDIVPKPNLPTLDKIIGKAREKRCSIQLNIPSDPLTDVLVIVSRHGQSFQAEEDKAVEALAVALAECLTNTEPQQTKFFDQESPAPKRARKKKGVLDEVADHVDGLEMDLAEGSADVEPPASDPEPTPEDPPVQDDGLSVEG